MWIFHFQLQSSHGQWLIYNLVHTFDYLQSLSFSHTHTHTHTHMHTHTKQTNNHKIQDTTWFRFQNDCSNAYLPDNHFINKHWTLCDMGLLGMFQYW
jgi:hypothetical protein